MRVAADTKEKRHTMKRASRTRCIKPTICTAPHHLPTIHHTHSPRTLALFAMRARVGGLCPCDLRKQRLHITPPYQVQLLPFPPLLCQSLARVARHALCECAVHLESFIARLLRHLFRCFVLHQLGLGGRLVPVLVVVNMVVLLLKRYRLRQCYCCCCWRCRWWWRRRRRERRSGLEGRRWRWLGLWRRRVGLEVCCGDERLRRWHRVAHGWRGR